MRREAAQVIGVVRVVIGVVKVVILRVVKAAIKENVGSAGNWDISKRSAEGEKRSVHTR